ncbi:MAG: hypothetical protein AAGI46_04095 [Planctomycetota bacterium]
MRSEGVRREDRRVLVAVDVTSPGLAAGTHELRLDWTPIGELGYADVFVEERGNAEGRSTSRLPVPDGRAEVVVPITVGEGDAPWRGRFRFRFEQSANAFEAGETAGLDLHALRIGDAVDLNYTDGDSDKPAIIFNAALVEEQADVLPSDPAERTAASLDVRLVTGRVNHLWSPGDDAPKLVVTNGGPDVAGQLRWSIRGKLDREPLTGSEHIRLTRGGEWSTALPKPTRFDVFDTRVTFEPDHSQGPLDIGQAAFASIELHDVLESRADSDDFLFGLANGARIGSNAEESARYVELASKLGANYVRQTRKWPQLEPKPGEWNWERMDAIVDAAERHNIHVQTVVGKPAPWAVRERYTDHPRRDRTPPQIEPFKAFLQAFIDRYGDRVRYYEVFNEPDIGFFQGTVEEYLEVLHATHDIVSQQPGLVTMTGGFTGFVHGGRKRGFQETVLLEAQDSFDIHTLHMHGVFPRFWNGLNDLVVRARDTAGVTEPMIFNETGMDTRHGLYHQAATLPKKAAAVRHHNAAGYVWYSLTDHPLSRENRIKAGHTYGLFDVDEQPKPAVLAYVTAARLIAQPESKYVGQLDVGEGRFAFVFQREEGDFVTLTWTEDPALAEALATVEVGGGATQIDLFGNAQLADVTSDGTVLRFLRQPTYLVTVEQPTSVAPLLLVDDIRETDDERLVYALAAGADFVNETTTSLDAEPVDPHADWLGSSLPVAQLGYTLPGGVTGTLIVPAPIYSSIAGDFDGEPDFELAWQQFVHNRLDHDPNTAAFMWQGRDDASADVWLDVDGDQLRIKVAVTDDIHHARLDSGDVTTGDAVELLLATTDGDLVHLALAHDGQTASVSRKIDSDWAPANDLSVEWDVDGNVASYIIGIAGDWRDGLSFDLRLTDLDAAPPGELKWESRLSLQDWQADTAVGTSMLPLRFSTTSD